MADNALVRAWAERGRRTTWEGLDVYTQVRGDRGKPALLILHGYPTSSYDFHRVADLLEDDYYLCLMDLPGYGLSDKPRDRRYTIADDVRLVDELVRTTFGPDAFTLVTHDRGDSVGLALLERLQHHEAPYAITGLVVLNGNVWLPLAQLTGIQRMRVQHLLVWGELDTIAPTRVADHVWETHLRGRPTPATYWRVPAGNHYVQLDQPEVVAALLRVPIGSVPDDDVPGASLVAHPGG